MRVLVKVRRRSKLVDLVTLVLHAGLPRDLAPFGLAALWVLLNDRAQRAKHIFKRFA